MLELDLFDRKDMIDYRAEFIKEWFKQSILITKILSKIEFSWNKCKLTVICLA